MFIDTLSSVQNPKIKDLLLLGEKSRERRERGLFVVEGKREISNCIEGGFHAESVFFCPDLIAEAEVLHLIEPSQGKAPAFFALGRNVYEKIACRGTTEGVVAVFNGRRRTLEEISLGHSPLVLVLESVEKPGNLGAVLRTADAAGVDAVLICDPLTDLYNPNIIRASIGGIFTRQVVACSSDQALKWLRTNGFKILTAQLQDSALYYDTDMTGSTAIVFGTESEGLTAFWRGASDAKIRIPMLGKLDSLNVSVSAAILCFEAVRQRQKCAKR